jgi:hypothetical protein
VLYRNNIGGRGCDCVVNLDGASKAYKKEEIDYIALQCKLLKIIKNLYSFIM